MPLDAYQRRAVETTGTNIVVSASAGAGKTSVLVSRLVKRCVKDRIPISRILAVTFTAAAASEMKKRLTASLYEHLSQAKSDEERNYLNQQIIDLETAQITTIDSFCLSIIQKYYNVIGLDPATSQNILSEGMDESYRQEAYHLALQRMAETDKERTVALLHHFSASSSNYDALYDCLKHINQFANNAINPKLWYENAAAAYRPIRQFKDFPQDILNLFFQMWQTDTAVLQELVEGMMNHVNESEKTAKKIDQVQAKLNALVNVKEALHNRNYTFFCEELTRFSECKTPADGKSLAYTSYRKAMEDQTKHMIHRLYDESELIQDNNDISTLCTDLLALAQSMQDFFQQLKKDHACMDFTDMERYALQILEKNDGEVADQLRQSLDEIMIDEFQDTSILQNEIIDRIAKKDNTFRVGDVKQSIYRFRQAKPALMRSLMHDPDTQRITLVHNYRSKDSIVRFTNMLFQKLMNVPGIQNRYEAEDIVTIGNPAYQGEEEPVPVTFTILNTTKTPKETPDQQMEEAANSKTSKANCIADQIVKQMENDPTLTFRDFAVLVKSHSDKIYLRRAFDAAGIAYEIDAREGFFQSEVCQMILSFLRVMLDFNDSIALLTLLTSSYFAFTDEQIAQCRIQYGSMQNALKEMYPQVIAEIRDLEDIANRSGVLEMLTQISNRRDFFQRLSTSEQANFDFLFEQIHNQKIMTLTDLFTLMSTSEEERSSEANATGKSDNVVTVTTIHHSKGLQYKIVFLWSTSRNIAMDLKDRVLVDDELYLGFNHYDQPYLNTRPTIQRMVCAYKSNLEDIEEFTRVLYVAVTRAERRLFIVDEVPKEIQPKQITLPYLLQRKGMTGLILSALDEGPLFRITYAAGNPPAKVSNPVTNSYSDELRKWQGEIPTVHEMVSPSSMELTFLPALEPVQKQGSSYGTKIHEILAALPNRTWTPKDLQNYDLYPSDQERILAFSQSPLYQEALQYEIHHEYPFFINTDQIHMNGIMDFVAFSPDKILLIDYKTDNCSLQEIHHRYQSQLNAYRKALSMIQPDTPIEVYAWSLHHKQAVLIVEE